ncbi:MAG: DNA-3-methyladenine glycosylase [Deltaproteobacteria bacterium]|nr:DNA-3-methyladenine glycosylase [Deltaproteobacteria bacterium]
MPLGPPHRLSFYARDSRRVARELVGCRLVHRLDDGLRLVVRLVEVEAYLGDGSDPASHAHRAAAVLLRAAEPIEGLDRMRSLRGLPRDAPAELIARGPGRLAQALGLELADDGQNLLHGALTLHRPAQGAARVRVVSGPRVGISRAAELPYRYFEAESRWVPSPRAGPRRRRRKPAA